MFYIQFGCKHYRFCIFVNWMPSLRVSSVAEAAAGNSRLLLAPLWQHPEVQLLHRPVHLQSQIHGTTVWTVCIQS